MSRPAWFVLEDGTAFRGRAVGADDVGVDRLRGRHQPCVVLAHPSGRAPLQQRTSPGLGEMQSLNRESLQRGERGRFVRRPFEQFLGADNRDDKRTPPQRGQEPAGRPHLAAGGFAFEGNEE